MALFYTLLNKEVDLGTDFILVASYYQRKDSLFSYIDFILRNDIYDYDTWMSLSIVDIGCELN